MGIQAYYLSSSLVLDHVTGQRRKSPRLMDNTPSVLVNLHCWSMMHTKQCCYLCHLYQTSTGMPNSSIPPLFSWQTHSIYAYSKQVIFSLLSGKKNLMNVDLIFQCFDKMLLLISSYSFLQKMMDKGGEEEKFIFEIKCLVLKESSCSL